MILVGVLAAGLLSGCSVRQLAIRKLGDALAGSGTTFASDDDPELVKAAVPFSLKLIESLLAETPRHEGLLLAAARGFTQYAYAFVHQEAEERQDVDLAASEALRLRAKRLYLRARDYGLRGLELRHPGVGAQLRRTPREAAAGFKRQDVPGLFWTAAAWGAAISLSKDDPALLSDQLIVETLLDRGVQLDETFDRGAFHTVLISYEMVRQGRRDDPAARARRHFQRANELAGGVLAGNFVSLAEAVPLAAQDRKEFEALLRQALAIDADAIPHERLANLVAQRRARWLLSRLDDLFFEERK